eukprot:TRINITY_DN107362_c0_g1_i1.p1 TRINITY_DN107362_c0_g1~~TRINITY_DN107362_c0_g1_i1.p1  ORF type:complete len:343 (+),score=44.61 TRINITY_DN107362_c0_g1_i1:31-1029(+)
MSAHVPVVESGDESMDRLAEDFAKRVSVHDDGDECGGNNDGATIAGVCRCGACKFHFSLSQVLSRGFAGVFGLVNCYCQRCRRAHAAAFATYATVKTAGLRDLMGQERVRVRTDSCGGITGEVLRAFCGKCFSSMATLPKVGKVVHISAGCLEVDSMPTVENFTPWCREEASPYLDFVPSKKQSKKARQDGFGKSTVTGSCSCGNCRYRLRRLPEEMQHCYCGNCRQLSGSAYQTWMPVEEIKWTSKQTLRLVRTTSHARRHVCTNCGVFLSIVYDEDKDAVWPLAGSLDDGCYTKQDLYARTTDVSHICVKYKQPWWKLPDDGLQRCKDAS